MIEMKMFNRVFLDLSYYVGGQSLDTNYLRGLGSSSFRTLDVLFFNRFILPKLEPTLKTTL